MDAFFMAQIMAFGGSFAPVNWAFCHGQLIPISQNTALFALIGTTYGGNGQTTFGLPDFRGRVPIGAGQGPGLPNYQLGQTGGNETFTLGVNNIPAHNHQAVVSVGVTDAPPTSDEPAGAILTSSDSALYGAASQANGSMAPGTATLVAAGGGTPFNIRKPFLAINYVICLQGIFPSRN